MFDQITLQGPHRDFEGIKHTDMDGIEYWRARELMPVLGYDEWRNFEEVIKRAQIAAIKSGQDIHNHFVDVNKMGHYRAVTAMVRNAGQLPQPFWLGAACGGGSHSLSASVARA